MELLKMEDVRTLLQTNIAAQCPYQNSLDKKLENIASFNALDRQGLAHGETERRLLLYTTQANEKVYIQYPGKEAARTEDRKHELDFRPVLKTASGTFIDDMDFKKIWDVIDRLGTDHCADLDILGTLFLQIAYMVNYRHHESQACECELIDAQTNKVIKSSDIAFTWNSINYDANLMYTLNDRFGLLSHISLEGFLYYNDLLAQNEDCKYHNAKGDKWDPTVGRINNCLSHLTVISHLRGKIGISKLIDAFQRLGVAPLPQSRLSEACGELVHRGKL